MTYATDMMHKSIEKEVYATDLVFDDLCEQVMAFIVPKKAAELRQSLGEGSTDADVYFALIAGDLKEHFTSLNPQWMIGALLGHNKIRLHTMHAMACAHTLIESGRTADDDDMNISEKNDVLEGILEALSNYTLHEVEDNVKRHFAELV